MKENAVWVITLFLAMFGGWSLGREIVDLWRGENSLMFVTRLLLSGVCTLLAIVLIRMKGGGDGKE